MWAQANEPSSSSRDERAAPGAANDRPTRWAASESRRVLIVEDNDATLTGLSELLKRAGYNTYATRSFEEGARTMREEAPDVLLADIRLGPFNGLQLLVTSPTRVPTIIMTGYPDPVLEADAVHLGAQFILKPVAPAALLAMVEAQLANKPATEPSNRRWARKRPSNDLLARVIEHREHRHDSEHHAHEAGGEPAREDGDLAAQIVDLSYGGMRLSLTTATDQAPCPSFRVCLPEAELSVQVGLVWSNQMSDGRWLCGAALDDADPDHTRAWCGLVDRLA